MDRDTRRLSHNKGNKIITQSSIPLSSDGEDGDQRVIGTTLYTKSNGGWFALDSKQKSDGWHGSTNRVKIMPNDFVNGAAILDGYELTLLALQGYLSFNNASAVNKLTAMVAIPIGYMALGVNIFMHQLGTIDPPIVKTFISKFTHAAPGPSTGTGTVSIIGGTAVTSEEFTLTQSIPSTDDTYITIGIEEIHGGTHGTSQHYLRGGYVVIGKEEL
jgi:hypothetical protein